MSEETPEHSQTRIIAVANQKGGVGKTTTVINLGANLATSEKRTLVIDLDPQCNASSGLGFEPTEEPTLLEVLLEEADQPTILSFETIPGLDVITGSPDLVGAEKLLPQSGSDPLQAVNRMIQKLPNQENPYEYIFLDCPPSLGMLTLNAFSAATHLMIPVQAEYFALEGLTSIMESLQVAQARMNEDLNLYGILITMMDLRTNLSRQVEAEIRNHYGDKVFRTTIPRNVRLSEAPSHALPVTLYDFWSSGAKAYMELTKEILRNGS
ncbi:MAG: ParA family protein [Candidatus Omnitrophica bacterium]|nr:ParA family protein [Candidatus Omnitrophota bacterium]